MPISVVLVDDHQIVLDGLRSGLRSTSDIEVVAEAETGKEAVSAIRIHQPDVVILDIKLPDMNGIAVMEYLEEEELSPAIIVLTAHNDPSYIAKSLSHNVASFMLKNVRMEELISAVRDAAKGIDIESNEETRAVSKTITNRERTNIDDKRRSLSDRETQVVRCLALGLSTKEIGAALGIHPNTVQIHLRNVFFKLDVEDRTEVAVWAVRNGLVD